MVSGETICGDGVCRRWQGGRAGALLRVVYGVSYLSRAASLVFSCGSHGLGLSSPSSRGKASGVAWRWGMRDEKRPGSETEPRRGIQAGSECVWKVCGSVRSAGDVEEVVKWVSRLLSNGPSCSFARSHRVRSGSARQTIAEIDKRLKARGSTTGKLERREGMTVAQRSRVAYEGSNRITRRSAIRRVRQAEDQS